MLSEQYRTEAGRRRLQDMHITTYPSVLNMRALQDLMAYSTVGRTDIVPSRDVRASRSDEANTRTTTKTEATNSPKCPPLMSLNQYNARMTELANEIHKENQRRLKDGKPVLIHSPLVSHDARTTYRLDYAACVHHEHNGVTNRALLDAALIQATALSQAAKGQSGSDDCTELERREVMDSMRYPYRTMPFREPASQASVYRHDYMPNATLEQLRSVSRKTDPAALRSSYAYSMSTKMRTNAP